MPIIGRSRQKIAPIRSNRQSAISRGSVTYKHTRPSTRPATNPRFACPNLVSMSSIAPQGAANAKPLTRKFIGRQVVEIGCISTDPDIPSISSHAEPTENWLWKIFSPRFYGKVSVGSPEGLPPLCIVQPLYVPAYTTEPFTTPPIFSRKTVASPRRIAIGLLDLRRRVAQPLTSSTIFFSGCPLLPVL